MGVHHPKEDHRSDYRVRHQSSRAGPSFTLSQCCGHNSGATWSWYEVTLNVQKQYSNQTF
jgi:hypothetical protein